MQKNRGFIKEYWRSAAGLFLVCFFFFGLARAQEVSSTIDRDTIKIGEKITYQLKVITDSSSAVVFPHGQTFGALELFDTTAIDTFNKQEQLILEREYGLTRFDSGSYYIPKQKIFIDGKLFYTDSFPVQVQGVAVDTTKQKLYPIKPAIAVEVPFSVAKWVWWGIGGLLLLALLVYLLLKARKKIIEKKKELPPYEKALKTLKSLDNNQALESGKVKEYYSSLSMAVKRYVDEKIDDRALESTTAEFIALLKAYKKDKQIYLKEQVIDSLDAVLKRADLAKFAGVKADKLTAREDRQTIEENINAFDQAIPEPTEEERMQDEAYRMAQEKKRKKRKTLIKVGLGVLVILILAGVFVGVKGLDYAKNLIYAESTTNLLQQKDWVSSQYGAFGIDVTTPKVLVREMDSVPKLFPQKSKSEARFSYGSFDQDLYVQVTNVRFKKSAQLDSLDVGELFDKKMESPAIANLTFKHKDFTTLQDLKAQKIFGTFKYTNPRSQEVSEKAYTFLLFNENGGLQELLISYNEGDEAAEKIARRIVNSVQFKTDNDG